MLTREARPPVPRLRPSQRGVSADFGYLRAWVDRCSCGFTALGLRKPHPGETAMRDLRGG
jgi:hypothetical protein